MIRYRQLKRSDVIPACRLIVAVYQKYNALANTPASVRRYCEFYSPRSNPPEKLTARLIASPVKYVALDGKKMVGVMRGRPDRLINLFVAGAYHKKGIGSKLLEIFETEAKKHGVKTIQMRASIYGTPFYLKRDYKKSTGRRKFKGISIQPLKKILK